MDLFALVSLSVIAILVIAALALSKRSATEILDWTPSEVVDDDPEVMLAAQNELRRRRGKPERTLEDVEAEWRAS